MYFEHKNDNKKYKFKVDNKLKAFGESNDETKIVKINKKLSKKKSNKRPIKKGANKYPELLDTITHEFLHTKSPKKHEKTVYKQTRRLMKTMGKKQRIKMYSLVN